MAVLLLWGLSLAWAVLGSRDTLQQCRSSTLARCCLLLCGCGHSPLFFNCCSQPRRLTLEQLARKEQPACSLVAKIPNQIKTYIHSWKHLSDVGVQLQGGSAPARQQLEAEAAGRMQPAWQPGQQQHSIQEEGEVAGDGGDITSQLLPGETAEEDLLQGLLEDDRAGGSLTGEGPGGDGDKQPQLLLLQGGQEAAAAAAEGAAAAGDYADLDPDFRDLLTEASAGSDLMPGEGGVDAATATSSGPERALTASHSLYRLVLKAPALEVHLHAKVFYNYPLVPPVFGVTKMLDTSSRSDPVPLGDVNEALELTQQVGVGAAGSFGVRSCYWKHCTVAAASRAHAGGESHYLVCGPALQTAHHIPRSL